VHNDNLIAARAKLIHQRTADEERSANDEHPCHGSSWSN
jgi:hypothetical protein